MLFKFNLVVVGMVGALFLSSFCYNYTKPSSEDFKDFKDFKDSKGERVFSDEDIKRLERGSNPKSLGDLANLEVLSKLENVSDPKIKHRGSINFNFGSFKK